jgi:hypothetical protein
MLTIEQTERWDMMQANAAAQQVSKLARDREEAELARDTCVII